MISQFRVAMHSRRRAPAIDIRVAGDNTGTIVVGDHTTLVINEAAGAVILPLQLVETTRRSDSSGLRPRPFPGLLGRLEEATHVRTALTAVPPVSVDVSGAPGVGKTALLRHVCADSVLERSFADGVVFFDVSGSRLTGDLLQDLFEAFFVTDRPYKPDEAEFRRYLSRTSPLVILDGFSASAREFERLVNLFATATFAVSGPARVMLGEGRAIDLEGLDATDALALMTRELGEPIADADVMSARAIYAALGGNARNIILAAAHARTQRVPLADLATGLRFATSPEEWLEDFVGTTLSDRERKTLAAFATVGGAPLDGVDLRAIAGVAEADSAAALQSLSDRRIIEFDGRRYRVRAAIAVALVAALAGLLEADTAVAYFAHAASGMPARALVERADAVAGALEHAGGAASHADVMTIAHRVGDAVALHGRWDRWRQLLTPALTSARASNEPADEAWALHQLGSLDFCLGDLAAAHASFAASLDIRAALGDALASATTRHNLTAFGWATGLRVALGIAIFALFGTIGALAAHRPISSLIASFAATWTTTGCRIAPCATTSSEPTPSHVIANVSAQPSLPPSPSPSASASNVQVSQSPTTPKPTSSAAQMRVVPSPPASPVMRPTQATAEAVIRPTSTPTSTPTPTPTPTPMPAPSAPAIVVVPLVVIYATVSPAGESASKMCYEVLGARTIRVLEPTTPIDDLAYPSQPGSKFEKCIAVNLTRSTVFTLVATDFRGVSTRRTITATVTPPPALARIETFAYDPVRGCLSYAVTDAQRATVLPAIGSVAPGSGCAPVSQTARVVRYRLYAYGVSGIPASSYALVPSFAPSPPPPQTAGPAATTGPTKVPRINASPIVPIVIFATRGTLAGAVVTGANVPVAGAAVSATLDATRYVATTDAGGRFRFANVLVGSYAVTAAKAGYVSAKATCAVPPESSKSCSISIMPSIQ